jgi:hypothetical protein
MPKNQDKAEELIRTLIARTENGSISWQVNRFGLGDTYTASLPKSSYTLDARQNTLVVKDQNGRNILFVSHPELASTNSLLTLTSGANASVETSLIADLISAVRYAVSDGPVIDSLLDELKSYNA